GIGYANSIADSRTDFGEISTQCLSYSTASRDVYKYNGSGVGTEATPLMPVLSPLMQYTNLFGGMVPVGTGGTTGGAAGAGGGPPPPAVDAVLKQLVGRRSVLDFSLAELNRLQSLTPADARNKIAIHTQAVMEAETSVASTINTRYPGA